MATQLVPFESASVPSFLKAAGPINNDLTSGVGLGFKVLSIKGKVFTIVSGGERTVVMKPGEDDEAATSLEVVLLRANAALAKVFYATGFEEGSNAKPDCHSSDGKKPDGDVEKPVNKTCADCPKNAWGSGNKGNSKACSDTRRVAIAPAGNLQDAMLLRVPPASLKPLAEFADTCNKRGAPYPSVVCKLKFEREESTPKLIFQPIAFLDEKRYAESKEVGESMLVRQIIGLDGYTPPAKQEEAEPEKETKAAPKEEKKAEPKAAPKEEKKAETKKAKPAPEPEPDGEDNLLSELNSLLGNSDD